MPDVPVFSKSKYIDMEGSIMPMDASGADMFAVGMFTLRADNGSMVFGKLFCDAEVANCAIAVGSSIAPDIAPNGLNGMD